MKGFVIVHDVYGYDFLLNLDNVICFRSEKDGKCSAKMVNGYVMQINASLKDVQACLDKMDQKDEEA